MDDVAFADARLRRGEALALSGHLKDVALAGATVARGRFGWLSGFGRLVLADLVGRIIPEFVRKMDQLVDIVLLLFGREDIATSH